MRDLNEYLARRDPGRYLHHMGGKSKLTQHITAIGQLDRLQALAKKMGQSFLKGNGLARTASCLQIWLGSQLEVEMLNVKEKMTEVIRQQPDDASYSEIMRELAFERMVDRGVEDSRNGRVVANNEMERRIRTWQK